MDLIVKINDDNIEDIVISTGFSKEILARVVFSSWPEVVWLTSLTNSKVSTRGWIYFDDEKVLPFCLNETCALTYVVLNNVFRLAVSVERCIPYTLNRYYDVNFKSINYWDTIENYKRDNPSLYEYKV